MDFDLDYIYYYYFYYKRLLWNNIRNIDYKGISAL